MDKSPLRSWKRVYESDLKHLVAELRSNINVPALIMLEGDLGSGKTSLSKVFIGESEEAVSPTYSVLYEVNNILHADFYRIKTREDIIHLELELYLENKDFFLAEWSLQHIESINSELPENFNIYLLEIESQPNHESTLASRNYHLSKIKII